MNIKRIWFDASSHQHTPPHKHKYIRCLPWLWGTDEKKFSECKEMTSRDFWPTQADWNTSPPKPNPDCLWAGDCQLYRLHTPTNTQTHWFCLTRSLPLYHITFPPTGQTMNLHSGRYGQRRRTGSRLHNDCSESVLVMWFVTPSALSLMWLRDGLFGRPCQMRWWPLIGEAEQKPGSAWPRPAICHAGHGEYRIRNMMSVKMLGDCGAVFVCVCVCLNELNGLDSTCYIYSHFSLTHSMTHTHTHTHT